MNRIPRPKNLTKHSIEYNKTNNDLSYNRMIELIINEYINNDYRIQNNPISLDQLSEHYNIPIELVYNKFNEKIKVMSGLFRDGDLLDTHRSLLAMVMANLVKDRGLIAKQLGILEASQDGTYKPYISGSVNDAIKMMMGSTKNQIDFIDKLMPKNSDIVNLIINGSKPDALTAHEAVELIRREALSHKGNKALPAKDQNISNLPQIFKEHKLQEMPNVRANQADVGANVNVTAKKIIEDPMAQLLQSQPTEEGDYGLSDYEEV
jgi:hypothetical protein